MTLDLTSKQLETGEADLAEAFSMESYSTRMLNPALKLYLTPTNIMRKLKTCLPSLKTSFARELRCKMAWM